MIHRPSKRLAGSPRTSFATTVALGLFLTALTASQAQEGTQPTPVAALASEGWSPAALGEPILPDPIWVYNDWSAYDELSDNIPLTEELAMRELDQILRLRKFGVHFDYYMMDAFWFAPKRRLQHVA